MAGEKLVVWLISLLVCVAADTTLILNQLKEKIAVSQFSDQDPVIPYLCQLLPSQRFIEAAEDEDFLNAMLYELGFGLLGVQPNSWAEKLKADSRKDSTCFAALYSIATTDTEKSTLAHSRRIIHRCCRTRRDL